MLYLLPLRGGLGEAVHVKDALAGLGRALGASCMQWRRHRGIPVVGPRGGCGGRAEAASANIHALDNDRVSRSGGCRVFATYIASGKQSSERERLVSLIHAPAGWECGGLPPSRPKRWT